MSIGAVVWHETPVDQRDAPVEISELVLTPVVSPNGAAAALAPPLVRKHSIETKTLKEDVPIPQLNGRTF